MIVSIQPANLHGELRAPASKSAMQRACAAALIRKGNSRIINPGKANDDKAALDVITQLGARITLHSDDEISISSAGVNPVSGAMHCGESGLGIRMFTPLAALSGQPLRITGEGSLVRRPMDFFDSVLPMLGVRISTNNGTLPLQVQGPLKPANIAIDGSLSSQFLTGLLMAYAACNARDVAIQVQNLTSKPYIDLTLAVMEAFGLPLPENQGYETFYFSGAAQNGHTGDVTYTVESDWSGGAFLLVAGAIAGGIAVRGLDPFSTQADKKVLEALMDAGAVLSVEKDVIHVAPPVGGLKPFQFDATDCPDLFPPLVALASYGQGTSVISGTHRLTHKESNRALTLQEEFAKLGVQIQLQGDLMLVQGGHTPQPAEVSSRHDHRIAMACAVAALKAAGPVTIHHAEAVNKSYPDFYQHLQQLGVTVSLNS